MYVMPDLIDLGFPTGKKPKWTSQTHRVVAQNVLLCNSRITSRTTLIDEVAKINAISKKEIKTVTAEDLWRRGVLV